MTISEQPKRGRGRPRKYAKDGDRQQAWKDQTGYESTDARKAYKREWAKANRLKKKNQIKVTNKEIKMNYPYGAKIKVTLGIGFSGAEQEGVICPKTDSSYDEEQWNALSESEREEWVSNEASNWSCDYITLEYAIVKP